jgi:SAM-dependent methyltransferase
MAVSSGGYRELIEKLKRIVPDVVVRAYRAVLLRISRGRNRKLPVKDVFSAIYRDNVWGGEPGSYCSGSGSNDRFVRSYVEMVRSFIRAEKIASVVDLGCGDFVVGGMIVDDRIKYVGVDVVDDLVERNNRLFGKGNVSFLSSDIISEPLPDGDLCLIRQVLQHLANDEIGSILGKLEKYRFVMITEHYPSPSAAVVPNRDKPHGGDTRILDHSGVFLDAPPFGMKISRLMLEAEAVPLVAKGETIRTFLIENRRPG